MGLFKKENIFVSLRPNQRKKKVLKLNLSSLMGLGKNVQVVINHFIKKNLEQKEPVIIVVMVLELLLVDD